MLGLLSAIFLSLTSCLHIQAASLLPVTSDAPTNVSLAVPPTDPSMAIFGDYHYTIRAFHPPYTTKLQLQAASLACGSLVANEMQTHHASPRDPYPFGKYACTQAGQIIRMDQQANPMQWVMSYVQVIRIIANLTEFASIFEGVVAPAFYFDVSARGFARPGEERPWVPVVKGLWSGIVADAAAAAAYD